LSRALAIHDEDTFCRKPSFYRNLEATHRWAGRVREADGVFVSTPSSRLDRGEGGGEKVPSSKEKRLYLFVSGAQGKKRINGHTNWDGKAEEGGR